MNITVLTPEILNEFQCIGSKCEDNCCDGFHVPIDKYTYEKYNNGIDNDELKNNLNRYVALNEKNIQI